MTPIASSSVAALRGEHDAPDPPAPRRQNEGHGRRLTVAFEALEAFPALVESRDRVLRPVLVPATPGSPTRARGGARTPEGRLPRGRRVLGAAPALGGGGLARRWGLPKSVASVIERHHADDVTGEAAFVRLADMLAHYTH